MAPKTEIVNAFPEKDFFILMLTRDISLEGCILDLVDNSLDGATQTLQNAGKDVRGAASYRGFDIKLKLSKSSFSIEDNCGGIPIDEAKNYAFHFGRRATSQMTKRGIGIYGIGMKRAIFKLGKKAEIGSSTKNESFSLDIDVDKWAAEEKWNFALRRGAAQTRAGTSISISKLNENVGEAFADESFVTELHATIARVYSLFIQQGASVSINGEPVKAYVYRLREAAKFKPVRTVRKDGDVTVEIWAGLGGLPADDDSADTEIPDVEQYGWYVVCNNRTVILGDKTDRTVWGDEKFPGWHNQYNGFLGVVRFEATDPAKLPWTTTKMDIDSNTPLYRRAVTRMKEATRPFVDYTRRRKARLGQAKKLEQGTSPKSIFDIKNRETMELPPLTEEPEVELINILYQKPREEVVKVARALGDPKMAAKMVGIKTFEHFLDQEVND